MRHTQTCGADESRGHQLHTSPYIRGDAADCFGKSHLRLLFELIQDDCRHGAVIDVLPVRARFLTKCSRRVSYLPPAAIAAKRP